MWRRLVRLSLRSNPWTTEGYLIYDNDDNHEDDDDAERISHLKLRAIN